MNLYKVVDQNRGSILQIGKYRLIYLKGTIVEAVQNTIGILCFEKIEDVYDFLQTKSMESPYHKVLTVEPLSEIIRDVKIYTVINPYSLEDFYKSRRDWTIDPPVGTVACMKVRVLD